MYKDFQDLIKFNLIIVVMLMSFKKAELMQLIDHLLKLKTEETYQICLKYQAKLNEQNQGLSVIEGEHNHLEYQDLEFGIMHSGKDLTNQQL
jgi:hypothetical protein